MTFVRLLHSDVILMNDLVYFPKSFSQTSLAHPDSKVLDLNIHVKHIMGFFLEGSKVGGFLISFPIAFRKFYRGTKM